MVRDNKNMIPVTMAVLLHVLVFGALFVAVDLRARATPVVPMAIKGTLVPENAVVVQPPKVEEPPPKPEPRTGAGTGYERTGPPACRREKTD